MSPRTTKSITAPDSVRPPLSLELIIDTACELIAESNTDELTMRKLSARLGVALGATYHHVPTREALLTLVANRINQQIVLRSTKTSDWQSTLRALMVDYAMAYSAYPGMASFAIANVMATGPADTRDQVLDLLTRAGFSLESAFTVLAAFFFYTSGFLAADTMNRPQPELSPEHVLLRFEQALDLMLKGAAAQLRADKQARRSR